MTQAQITMTLKEFMGRTRYAIAQGQAEEAIKLAGLMAGSYPGNAQAQYFAGTVCFEVKENDKAVDYLVQAVNLKPSHAQAKEHLLYALYLSKGIKITDDLCRAFCEILRNPRALNGDLIVRVWVRIMQDHGFFGNILQRTSAMDFAAFKAWWDRLSDEDCALVASDLLTLGMVVYIIPDVGVETFLVNLRRVFLEQAVEGKNQGSTTRLQASEKLAIALAEWGFNSDYILPVEAAERSAFENLIRDMNRQQGKTLDAFTVAVVASYEPLFKFPVIMAALGKMFSPVRDKKKLSLLICQQITEPQAERKLALGMPALSEIRDGVSEEVRRQYEENPYPRWTVLKAVHVDPIQNLIPAYKRAGANILIAGCATGAYPINVALAYPRTKVTGIDLSLASLSYGKRKANELRVKNLEFLHGDILKIGDLGRSFDVIETVGVLHHMKEPDKGLAALLGVLKPDGFIKIGLYSATARRHITACREEFTKMGLSADAEEGIRKGREYVLSLPADHPFHTFEKYNDFYNASMMRDMLFHVQEHCYTLPMIASMLEKAGLEFLGFSDIGAGEAKTAYGAKFPDDQEMTDLENWHIFEKENPDTFIGMYKFWCRKI